MFIQYKKETGSLLQKDETVLTAVFYISVALIVIEIKSIMCKNKFNDQKNIFFKL